MSLKNRYRIVQLIAHGRFNKTFLAVDEMQSPPSNCVVKQLEHQEKIEFKKAINLYQEEAVRLKELGKHPQIPSLLDYFDESGKFYLVQEVIDGINLAKIVELEGVFNEAKIWHLLENLLPVIKFIHDYKVIHRDIKPENIIRKENKALPWGMRSQAEPGNELMGRFVLVDLGGEFLTLGTGSGSAEYVAPEQLRGNAVFASDLYSLGVSCIYLLTGISPFNLFDSANNCWAWREYVHEEISSRLAFILDKLLQNDLNQRLKSADEVMGVMGKKYQINQKLKIKNYLPLLTLAGHEGLFSGVNSVAIAPDNQILASGSDDKTIRLWNIETGEVCATLKGHTNFVQSVAFSPDGTILASGSDDKTIKLWDLKTYEEICTLSEHSRAVKSVTFSPIPPPLVPTALPGNARQLRGILASGSWDKTIKLWDLNTKKAICTISGHQLQVSEVTFSPDGHFLASASFDRTVRLWDLRQALSPARVSNQIFAGHFWPVFAVGFSPDGNILATASEDKTIKLWDLGTYQEIQTILGHSWSVVALAFSRDGQILISGSWDKTVKLWQVRDGKEIDTLAGHLDAVSAVAISPDGQIIASGSKDKTIKLWSRASCYQ